MVIVTWQTKKKIKVLFSEGKNKVFMWNVTNNPSLPWRLVWNLNNKLSRAAEFSLIVNALHFTDCAVSVGTHSPLPLHSKSTIDHRTMSEHACVPINLYL